jgi:predicted phosphoribosyltransferase
MSFKDRAQAGRKLAQALTKYKDQQPVVLALPRGGVPVAVEVAAALGAPLDLVLVRKIGVPFQPELAMGAIADGPVPIVVRNEYVTRTLDIDEAQFKEICDVEIAEIERRRARYLGGRKRVDISGRTAIVIDDGIATGATTQAALRAVRAGHPKMLVLAVPVAPTESLQRLREEVDDLVCLEDYQAFGAIGLYYHDFRQVTDDEVVAMLARFPVGKARRSKAPAA